MGQTAGVVHKLVAVALSELELVLGIYDDWVVGVAYLADTGAVQEFSIAGDSEDALGFVSVLLIALLIEVGINGDGARESQFKGTVSTESLFPEQADNNPSRNICIILFFIFNKHNH